MRRVDVTDQAHAYVIVTRRDTDRAATWFDVAEAYDAGLESGAKNTRAAKRALDKLPSKVSVFDSTGFRRRRPISSNSDPF